MDRPTYPDADFKSAHEWHIFHVYRDPEFEADMMRYLKDNNPKDKISIISKYAISEADFNFYDMGFDELGVLNTDLQYSIHLDKEQNQIVITLDLGFTKADFLRIWHKMERDAPELVARKHRRRRGPENHELVYAIFKARQRGDTFKMIFSNYANGALSYYANKNNRQFKSEDDLEKYYSQYKPRT